MCVSIDEELRLSILAQYPVVFLVTVEEDRAISMVEEVCKAMGKTFLNPRKPGAHMSISEQVGCDGPNEAVVLITNLSKEPLFSDIRSLADLEISSGGKKRIAIVISGYYSIPCELEHISVVLEMPLPCASVLYEVLEQVCVQTQVLLIQEDMDAMVRVGQGLTLSEARRAFSKALLGWPQNAILARMSVEKDKRKAIHRSNVLEHVDVSFDFDSVGGMDQLKAWLGSRKKAFSSEAKNFGLPTPKGLLLMGIQGCGKSMCAKAVASFWELPIVRLDLSAVYGQNNPEESLRMALKTAEAMSPVVLWIDEIEKGFDITSKGESARLLGGLITWLQEKQHEVFVVATANRVESLPPELPRKGRFDEIFFVDLPDAKERHEIFSVHLKKRKYSIEDFEIEYLVDKTEKMTGSEIEQLIISAMYIAFEKGRPLNNSDLRKALANTVTLYETFENEIKSLRQWARKRARSASADRSKVDYFK